MKVVAAAASAAETIETGARRGERLYTGRRAISTSNMGHPFEPFGFAANELEASSVHLPPQRSPKLLEVLGQALP